MSDRLHFICKVQVCAQLALQSKPIISKCLLHNNKHRLKLPQLLHGNVFACVIADRLQLLACLLLLLVPSCYKGNECECVCG
jgi:hypothetical protein